MTRSSLRRPRRLGAAFARDRRGVAAVEFALISPTVILILVALIDLGGMLYTRFQLDASLSAAANYAMVNATSANSTSGAGLASTLAGLISSGQSSNWANSSVTVNAGPQAGSAGGTVSTSGSASSADSCYCPTGTAASVTWGGSQTCGATCTGGGYAGKFVLLSASRSYTPIFSGYGLVSQAGTMTADSLVQVQ
ncbi:MAG TPA: TadE/TadG family type IV pilus assembly protein [Caulobacteraceae bacterium]